MKLQHLIVCIVLIVYSFIPLCAHENQQVLIINSYHKGFQWSDDVLRGIDTVFEEHTNITTHILYMDSKRINSDAYFEKLRELYKLQLEKQKYNLILCVDKFAYDFVLKYYHELFTNEPVVFVGIEQFSLTQVQKQGLEDRVYGILEKRAIGETITMIRDIIPTLKKLYIINDASANGDDSEPFIQEAMQKDNHHFSIEYIRKSTLADLEKRFEKPNPDEAVFFIRFYNDKDGNFYKNNQIAAMIQKSALPVFVTDTLFIQKGAYGGKLVPIQQLGEDTGKLVLSVLNHERLPSHVSTDETYLYQFDFQKIKQFKLYPNAGVTQFEVVNAPLTFFEKHRAFIDFVFVISPLLVVLILGLIHNIYMRIKSEKELRLVELQKNKHQQFIIQQSKLAEIGEIFSSIAHQWKNPLVEIATIAQEHVYSCKEQADEQSNQYVHDIMVQVRYMTDTINDFQKFIMPSTAKTVFDVSEAVETMLKIINHNLKYNYIDVTIDKANATNLLVSGYKNEFMQTLLNIVNNAKDQIKEKRDHKELKRGRITIKLYNASKKIFIEIHDNAGGISPRMLPQIFDAYFTTKEHGHGIGLYMSKLIIEDKMGGKIDVQNTQVGACFRIRLENEK
ncbi:MAG: sensor histidine kinase [Sulfurospirillaceae bacterium]|nr:sensor histidine kinase [Sulfurospirillaceae bacterium]